MDKQKRKLIISSELSAVRARYGVQRGRVLGIRELAEMTGIPHQWLTDLEYNRLDKIDYGRVEQLCNVFDVSLDQIVEIREQVN